jgi:hypothetical protein
VLALAEAAGAEDADFEGCGTAPDEPEFELPELPEPLELADELDALGAAEVAVDGFADEPVLVWLPVEGARLPVVTVELAPKL